MWTRSKYHGVVLESLTGQTANKRRGMIDTLEIKIAICDDELQIDNQLEQILLDLVKERKIECRIDVYTNGEQLCEELQMREYDLLFLDIELPGKNGVTVGTYIRELLGNDIIQIAYISSKREYAMELFDIRPIHFLIKPLEAEQVAKVLDTYIKINGGKTDLFHFRKGYTHHKVEIYRIKYFIRESRKVKLYTVDGMVEFYESLETIYERVKDYGFLFIHKSYMVNYRFLKKIAYDHVIMTDGQQFSISQSRRKDIREKYWELEGD